MKVIIFYCKKTLNYWYYEDNNDPMTKEQNKKDAIYLLKLAYNYIRIEKYDILFN